MEEDYTVSYDPTTEVLVTVGVSEALDLALRAVLNPGDEVLYHEPCYVSYSPSIALAHGRAVSIRTREVDEFKLRPEALRAALTPKSKVLLLNFPTNPTGGRHDRGGTRGIAAKICREHNLLVITDEIYSELSLCGGPRLHRFAAGNARAHHLPSRFLQGLRHDRISRRVRLRTRTADRRHDAHPSIRHPLRAHRQPGGGA